MQFSIAPLLARTVAFATKRACVPLGANKGGACSVTYDQACRPKMAYRTHPKSPFLFVITSRESKYE